ncbi:unnamed protein product [Prunus armeniaca]
MACDDIEIGNLFDQEAVAAADASITSASKSVVTVVNEPMSIPYGVKLSGTNYTIWSQVVTMFIAGRG